MKKNIFVKKDKRGFNFCNNNKCRFCPLINKKTELNAPTIKKATLQCKMSHVGAPTCITCKICHKQFVGQTSNRLRDRFQGNFNDIQ